jgi:hypothetical protein
LLDPLLKLFIIECVLQVDLPDVLLSDLDLRAGAVDFGLEELLEHRVFRLLLLGVPHAIGPIVITKNLALRLGVWGAHLALILGDKLQVQGATIHFTEIHIRVRSYRDEVRLRLEFAASNSSNYVAGFPHWYPHLGRPSLERVAFFLRIDRG